MEPFDTSHMDPQHIRWCQEYALDRNATRAAKVVGYSVASAHTQGYRLSHRLDCELYVEWLREYDARQIGLSRANVLEEFRKIAFHDSRNLYDDEGALKPVHLLDDDIAAAVAGVEVSSIPGTTVVLHKIKLLHKDGALDKLAKHYNIYEDHQKSGIGEINITIAGKDADL